MTNWTLLIACFLVLIVLARTRISTARRNRPPGPPGLPLLGNAFQLSRNAWTIFEQWKREFGPLIYLSIAGQSLIVLNSNKVATELLTRRANKYSDRHRTIVAGEILTGGNNIAFAQYGDRWRRQRKSAHQGLRKEVQHTFNAVLSMEAILLVNSLLDDPESWDDHLQRTTASLTMAVTYNLPPIKSTTDPSLAHIRGHMERLAYALYPGNFWVEIFPWMTNFPTWMAPWKKEAQAWYKKDSNTFVSLYEDTVNRMATNNNPSFVASLEAQKDQQGLNSLEKAWLAAVLYGAGAETSYSSLQWFVVAMVHYPKVQERAQKELDAVVGASRMPEFSDFQNLPYLRAVVKEVLRWRPPLPLGLPHRLTEDDWYNGCFIPKGTLCLANIWAINRDTDLFGSDAQEFNPDRYLDENGQLLPGFPDTQDESHASFGYGRRICVGRHLANSTLMVDLAAILWSCRIRPFVDETGHVHLPDNEANTNTGLTLHPVPFRCVIEPRFTNVRPIVDRTKEAYSHANGL